MTATAAITAISIEAQPANLTRTLPYTASVFLRILDSSPPAPMPDSSPGIFALVASTTKAAVGEAVTLKASAADPNGDPLTYAWTSSCPSGTFSATDSAETTWSTTAPGACTLTITVTAKGKSASQQVDIVVLEVGSGVATVEGDYISAPYISNLYVIGPNFD